MSASWFLVSMYLIWILGSRLIRSNNQSNATLWVLETCLIVGLLPFIIILITASLSSNTYNKASWCENWTFEGINQCYSTRWSFLEIVCLRFALCYRWQRVSPVFQESESCFQGRNKSRAGIPSNLNPASKEMISDSVELCVNMKFVSYTSNLLEQMYDFQKHIMFTQKWIFSPQDVVQNRSLETVPVCIVWQCFHMANFL